MTFAHNLRYAVLTLAAISVLADIRTVAHAQATDFPPMGPPTRIKPGIDRYIVTATCRGRQTVLWVYLPSTVGANPLPCVLIAPAGTRLIHGSDLGDNDMPEHLPYVRAGFAVVAYELAGNMTDLHDPQGVFNAVRAYKDAEAGLENARAALDYIAARIPRIDRRRIYAAGHSSAGTVALDLAAHEPRIRACAAYAPACDLDKRVAHQVVVSFGKLIPDFAAYIHRNSPIANVATLHSPVFLFHADDDSNVPTADVDAFAATLRKTNGNVTYVKVPTGDHYDSMIQQGIPAAIHWLKSLTP